MVCGPRWLSRYSDSLRAGLSGDRIPVGARFSAPSQTDPGAHPASYTIGTGPFPGVKRPGRGVDHVPLSNAEVKERVELYLCSQYGSSWSVVGWNLPLPLPWYGIVAVRLQAWNKIQNRGNAEGRKVTRELRSILYVVPSVGNWSRLREALRKWEQINIWECLRIGRKM